MIKANFHAYGSYMVDTLHQWDLNRTLEIEGLNLSVTPEVHFSNANMDKAIVRQATLENHVVNVMIPNSLLQSPLPIHAYIGIYDKDTFKTIETVEIPVIPRPKPLDYTLETTDDEIYSFNRLENMMQELKRQING